MKAYYYQWLFITLFFAFSIYCQAQINYTWTGTHSNNWNDSLNWTPKGIPQSADDISVSGENNVLVLDQNRIVSSISIQNSYLDLRGYTLTVTNSSNIRSTQVTTGSLGFAGSLILNGLSTKASIYAVCSSVTAQNNRFDSTVYIERIGNSLNDSWGANTFSQLTTLVQNSPNSTWFLGGNGIEDAFQQDVTFAVKQGSLYISHQFPAFFRGSVNLICSGDGITVGDSIPIVPRILYLPVKSILTTDFTAGTLTLNNVKQEGLPLNLQFTGTAKLVINYCDFKEDVMISTAGTDTSTTWVKINNSSFWQSTIINTAKTALSGNNFNVINKNGSQTQIIQTAISNQNELLNSNMITGTFIAK